MLAASMAAVVGGAALSTSAQAGPPPVPNRTGISTALKIGGDVYQIDCGLGSPGEMLFEGDQ